MPTKSSLSSSAAPGAGRAPRRRGTPAAPGGEAHQSSPQEGGQVESAYLPGRRAGERLEPVVLLGPLRRRQVLTCVRVEGGVVDRDHDRRADPLAPLLVVDSEDRDVVDAGHLAQHLLDLGGVDVHAATDDQVLAAPVEEDVAVVVDPPQVADGERRPVRGLSPGGGGLLRVAEVAEPRMGRYDAPEVTVLVHSHHATRPGPTQGARALEPLLAAAGRELPLGRPVELPRRALGELLDQPALHPLRAGRAGVGDQPERARSGAPMRVPVREQPLQVGRHAEHRRRPVVRDRGRHGRRVEGPRSTTRPPASRVPIANRSGAEWWIGLSTRFTSSAAKPHRSRSSASNASAAAGVEQSGEDALGPPRRTAGQVDRPTTRRSE